CKLDWTRSRRVRPSRSGPPGRPARTIDPLATRKLQSGPCRSAGQRVAKIHRVQIDDAVPLAKERHLPSVGREHAVPTRAVGRELDVLMSPAHLDRVQVVLSFMAKRVDKPCAV